MQPSPLHEVADQRLSRVGVTLLLKRDDLLHPDLPGNKWRKLRDNLVEARRLAAGTLLTFGGAYSNHLRAVAVAGARYGFATVGVVRGEEHLPLNPSLAYAVSHGMRLTYLERTAYRAKHTATVLTGLRERWGDPYVIPEGGSNEFAVRGCAELPAEIDTPFDVLCVPVGTGGTLAGVAAGISSDQRALGFAVLRAPLEKNVEELQIQTYGERRGQWSVEHAYHGGGYARTTAALATFAADFTARHDVPLDPVYTGKMMFGIVSMATTGAFAAGTRVVAVITGPAAFTAPRVASTDG